MSTAVGEVRPSQLLWTYGPGALVDLPSLSVVTMGLDYWDLDRCHELVELRLLAAVRRILGPQVESLRLAPIVKEEIIDPNSPLARVGVPVRPFPRYLRCVKCGLLAEFDSGLFSLDVNRYRPENTRFLHTNCSKPGISEGVPARFLMACRNGHLDDFPWHWFVHGGPSTCQGTLRFYERGASLQTENLWVSCDACDTSRSLVHAFGRLGQENLPACRGRHPHLNDFEDCDEQPRAVLLGATNSWFPMTVSVLAIPPADDPLGQLVIEGWDWFEDDEDERDVSKTLKKLVKRRALPGIEKYSAGDVWPIVEAKINGTLREADFDEEDIKRPEWEVLISPNPRTDFPHFLSEASPVPPTYSDKIQSVLLLTRLREVNALIGYTRVEAPEENAGEGEGVPRASLCSGSASWVPASEVHGEGVFIRFKEEQIADWETWPSVRRRDSMLLAGHRAWRSSRRLSPDENYPDIRYSMLHTLAHLLIRELALECGYNAASIRERIYATTEGDSMAGILIYTAAADSDGTLGGLVELGKPESLGRLIDQALTRARVCSSDPLCSEHDPGHDRSLHAASCHACGFVAETSCERGNRYLDRALLVPTFDCDDAAFLGLKE